MKRQGTRGLAGLCALALLLCAVLVAPAAADEVTVYQLALNDRLKAISVEFTPIVIGGSYYVPYTVFDKSTTDVDLGISYGQVKRDEVHTMTLYSINNILVFDLIAGTCTTNQGESLDMKATVRNGRVYLPLNVYQHFSGLKCSFTPTSYGTLVRITNGQEGLGTSRFVDSAASKMRTQYNKYLESINVQPPVSTPVPSATPTTRPGVSPTPTPTTQPDNRQEVRVYLAFRCDGSGGLEDVLTELERNGVRALFFFRPEELVQNADQVRRMVGGGHVVGLVAEGATTEQVAENLARGNTLLERIARLRTHTALVEGGGADAAEILKHTGWALWSGNVDGRAAGRSQTVAARTVMDAIAAKRSVAQVMMDDSAVAAGVLSSVLTQLREEQYSIRLAVETELY